MFIRSEDAISALLRPLYVWGGAPAQGAGDSSNTVTTFRSIQGETSSPQAVQTGRNLSLMKLGTDTRQFSGNQTPPYTGRKKKGEKKMFFPLPQNCPTNTQHAKKGDVLTFFASYDTATLTQL